MRPDRVYRGQGFQSLTPEFGACGAGAAAMKRDTSARRFNRASLETMAEHNRATLQGAIAASKALVQRSRLIKQQSEEALARTAAIRKAFMASPGAKRIATGEDHAQRAAD